MKLYFPVVKSQELIDKLALAGYELSNKEEADNYIPGIVRISNPLNAYLTQNKPAKAADLKLELATKSGLMDAVAAANWSILVVCKVFKVSLLPVYVFNAETDILTLAEVDSKLFNLILVDEVKSYNEAVAEFN